MIKILTKEEIDAVYSKIPPEEIASLTELIHLSHSKWKVKMRKPSRREIVDWYLMKQRALADTGDSQK